MTKKDSTRKKKTLIDVRRGLGRIQKEMYAKSLAAEKTTMPLFVGPSVNIGVYYTKQLKHRKNK